jgi:hypothetical protein
LTPSGITGASSKDLHLTNILSQVVTLSGITGGFFKEPHSKNILLQFTTPSGITGASTKDLHFENIYTQYHTLGANGVMDDVRKQFYELELEKEEEVKC